MSTENPGTSEGDKEDEDIELPEIPEELNDELRKKLITSRRRYATKKISEIEELRKAQGNQDVDLLEWYVKESQTCLIELKKLQLGTSSKSDHIKNLERAIGVGECCIKRWKETTPSSSSCSNSGNPKVEVDPTILSRSIHKPRLPKFSGSKANWP